MTSPIDSASCTPVAETHGRAQSAGAIREHSGAPGDLRLKIRQQLAGFMALAITTSIVGACNKDDDQASKSAKQAVASASAAPSAEASAPRTFNGPSANAMPRTKWRVPSGPKLGILPGKGVGAIRFGATPETVERLMGSSCDVKTDEICRYVNQAIEFKFTDGVTTEIRIHRKDRPVEGLEEQTFGPFNGGLRRDVKFGMYRDVAVASMGNAERIEGVESSPYGTIERHHYPDIILEYDKLDNGNVVLGGMVLRGTPPTAAASGSAAKSSSPPAATSPQP